MLFMINSTGWFIPDGRFLGPEYNLSKHARQVFSIELEGATFEQNSGKMTLPAGGVASRFDYEQATDPGAVGAGKWWADTANNRVGRRNDANTAWVYFF
jgi:hypothetical protein